MNGIFLIFDNEMIVSSIVSIICAVFAALIVDFIHNWNDKMRKSAEETTDIQSGKKKKLFQNRNVRRFTIGAAVFFVIYLLLNRSIHPKQPDSVPADQSAQSETVSAGSKNVEPSGASDSKAQWVGEDGTVFYGTQIDGKMEGKGEAIFKNGEKYIGEFKKGLRDGEGTLYSSSGTVLYKGEWKDNVKEGKGEEYCDEPSGKYVGEYKAGKREGDGIFYWENGNRYEGKWESGVRNGMGTLIGTDGTATTQIWLEDQFVTNLLWNVETWIGTDGTVYTGEKKNDKIDGYGRVAYNSGEIYIGELKDGVRDGKGICYYVNGNRYEGEWKDGKKDGTGVFCFEQNGGIYNGEFSDDTMNGTGNYYSPSGFRYEGEWKDGNYFGKGTAWYSPNDSANYSYFEGEWAGTPQKGTMYYKDGTSETGLFQDYKLIESTGEQKGVREQSGVEEWTDQDGNQYVGIQKEGLLEGKGISIDNQYNEIYIGEFIGGIPNGYGIEYYHDGDYYVGTFVDGKRNGTGVYYYSDGGEVRTWYSGEWKDGKRNGNCEFRCFDNLTYYIGNVVDSNFSGIGSKHYTDGVYYGEWQKGVRSGTGVFNHKDGSCYFGGYEEDQKSGYGVKYYIDGSCYEGEWAENTRNGIGTEYTADGDKKYGTWMNGEYQE